MTTAIVISADDNVATALEAIEAGEIVRAGKATVTAIDAIPRGHKIALRAIAPGGRVVKYGSPIGTASTAIVEGAHVHTHNVASARGRGDLAVGSQQSAVGSHQSSVISHQSSVGSDEPPVDGPRLAEPRE